MKVLVLYDYPPSPGGLATHGDLLYRGLKEIGVADDRVMILTVGGDPAWKGAQEVIQALALIDTKAPDWKYVCKVWPQPRTEQQNLQDMQLATHLGIEKNVVFTASRISRNFMPYLIAACDIYAAPSHEAAESPKPYRSRHGRPPPNHRLA